MKQKAGVERERNVEMARKGYVRAAVAARLAKVSPSTIYRAQEKGKLKGVQLGGANGERYVDLASFREWLGEEACGLFRVPADATDAMQEPADEEA